MTTTDPFTEAARAEALRAWVKEPDRMDSIGTLGAHIAEWARTHLAAQRAEGVRAWAVQQYPSGTPLDQDRRMVAAETEAHLSGRTEREMSELAQAAKHAGPVDPPAQEPTDAEVEAATLELYVRSHHSTGRQTPFESLDHEDKVSWVEDGRAVLSAARAARRDEGHVHDWRWKQNTTSRGFPMPPIEVCPCGAARDARRDEEKRDG